MRRPSPLGSPLAPKLAAAILGLQVLAASRLLCTPEVLAPHLEWHLACDSRAWPFLDYSMFERGHALGEHLVHACGVLVLEDGSELQLRIDRPPRAPGSVELANALAEQDCDEAWRLAHRQAQARGLRCTGLYLQREVLRLEREGLRLVRTERSKCPAP